MKKSLSVILALFIALFAFAACEKEKEDKDEIKKSPKSTAPQKEYVSDIGGVVVTDFQGEIENAVLTEENGKVIRDEAGNIIVLVTDSNGEVIENDNGEVVTKYQAIDSAIVIGNRIEMPDYAINIPDGWSDLKSYADLSLKKDGTEDIIVISAMRDEKLADVEADSVKMLEVFPSESKVNKSLTIAGEEASFVSGYITVDGTGVYLGSITFSHQGVVYKCMITSDRDLSGEIDSIVAIIDTIEFIH